MRAIARAWSWRRKIESGEASTIQDIAAAEKVSDRFVSRMMRMPFGRQATEATVKSAIAYYRVSTQRQGRSGLGIEAQRATVARFAEAEGMALIAEYTEVETGKGADALDRRPQLAGALEAA